MCIVWCTRPGGPMFACLLLLSQPAEPRQRPPHPLSVGRGLTGQNGCTRYGPALFVAIVK